MAFDASLAINSILSGGGYTVTLPRGTLGALISTSSTGTVSLVLELSTEEPMKLTASSSSSSTGQAYRTNWPDWSFLE